MSNVIRINWTVADGNVWTDEGPEWDREASLDHLAEMIEDALNDTYPGVEVTVRRENVCGAARELQVVTESYPLSPDDDMFIEIKSVADDVWAGGGWYVSAA